MPRLRRRRVTGSYELLRHVPKRAVIDHLLSLPNASLSSAYQDITRQTVSVTRSHLVALPLPDLIRVFAICESATEEDARQLHNNWRYRGMKSLYLYRFFGSAPDTGGLPDRLNISLSATRPRTLEPEDHRFDEQLIFKTAELFPIRNRQILEIGYSYVVPMDYVDPVDEEAKIVMDLRSGFVWLCDRTGWAAISARDLETKDRIAQAVQRACGCSLTQLQFNKEIVSELESRANRRRVALIDPQTKTTRRYTGQHLGADTDAQQEIDERWGRDEAPFNGYNVMVDAHTEMVLGYNTRQGKIFFSKDLTAEQLRVWGPSKIEDIQGAVNTAIRRRPAFRHELIDQHLRTLPEAARPAASELAAAVAACKSGTVSEQPLQMSALDLRASLGKLVSAVIYAVRDDTEEVADIQCPSCQSERISVSDDNQVRCSDCSEVLDPMRLPIVGGQPIAATDLNEIVQLLPGQTLLNTVLSAASAITTLPLNVDEEFFFVRASTLFYRRLTGNVVLTVDQVPELSAMIGPSTARDREQVSPTLMQFKEKCPRMSSASCETCVADRKGDKCMLRLFGLMDSAFTPQPHGSVEYGDYARLLTIDGHPDKYLSVVMKKAPRRKGPITSSTYEGREILEQSFKYLQNGGVQAVGVCVPHLIHDNLKSMLIHLARLECKKIIFFDTTVMTRIVATVMRRQRLSLQQL